MPKIILSLLSLTLAATACGDDSNASAAAWCDGARDVETLSDNLDTADDFRAFRDAVDDVKDSAPPEIREEVGVTADFLDAMAGALDDNDDNVLLAFDQVQLDEGLDDYEAAGRTITDYNATECGIGEVSDGDDDDDPSVDDDEADFSGGLVAGLAEQLGVTEDQARCLVTELDLGPGDEPDISGMFDALETCGIDPFSLATG